MPVSIISIAHVPGTPLPVMKTKDFEVRALSVPHYNVPSLAYRVDVGGRSVAFSSDQNGDEPAFTRFIAGVDVLIMNFSLSESAAGNEILESVFAIPSKVGKIARDAGVGTLVLSHLMGFGEDFASRKNYSLYDLPENLAAVRKFYSGRVVVARDLECIALK